MMSKRSKRRFAKKQKRLLKKIQFREKRKQYEEELKKNINYILHNLGDLKISSHYKPTNKMSLQ